MWLINTSALFPEQIFHLFEVSSCFLLARGSVVPLFNESNDAKHSHNKYKKHHNLSFFFVVGPQVNRDTNKNYGKYTPNHLSPLLFVTCWHTTCVFSLSIKILNCFIFTP